MDNSFWFWILIFIVLPVLRSILDGSKKRKRPKVRPLKRSRRQRLPGIQVGNDPLEPSGPVIVSEPIEEPWSVEIPVDQPQEAQWDWLAEHASAPTGNPDPQFQEPPAHIKSLFEAELAARQQGKKPTTGTRLVTMESGESIVTGGSSFYPGHQGRADRLSLPGKGDLRRLLLWSELLAPPLALRQPEDTRALAGFKPAHLE